MTYDERLTAERLARPAKTEVQYMVPGYAGGYTTDRGQATKWALSRSRRVSEQIAILKRTVTYSANEVDSYVTTAGVEDDRAPGQDGVATKKVSWHPVGTGGAYGTPGPAGLTGNVIPPVSIRGTLWDWNIEDQMGNVLVEGFAEDRESAQQAVEAHRLFQGE